MSLLRHIFRLRLLTITFRESTSSFTLNTLNKSVKLSRLYCASSAISHPTPEGCDKVYPPKIKSIVEEIAKLTLIEVSDLNECLKKTLNIKDVSMSMGVMPMAAAAPVKDEEAEPEVIKSSFTVKLVKIEDTKKVAVIKEIKNQIEGMNLVQAKKFVESVPQVLRADIGKDEAEKLKQLFESIGGICEIS